MVKLKSKLVEKFTLLDQGQESMEHMLPRRSDTAILFVSLAVLIAGPLIGFVLARLFAPGSGPALLIGFFLFPFAHLAGRFAWAVMGFAVDPKSEGRRMFRALSNPRKWIGEWSKTQEGLHHSRFEGRFPRGGAIFILAHTLFGLAGGLLVGLLATGVSATTVVCAYTFAGTLYGSIVYFIAWKGYLLMRSERAD